MTAVQTAPAAPASPTRITWLCAGCGKWKPRSGFFTNNGAVVCRDCNVARGNA